MRKSKKVVWQVLLLEKWNFLGYGACIDRHKSITNFKSIENFISRILG